MAAHRQRHAHDGVAGLQERQVDREVGGRARVGLDVRMLDAEEPVRALDRQFLEPVDDLLTFVVPLAGIPLGVLVREDAAERFQHRTRDVVLRRDQADRPSLPLDLLVQERGDLGVGLGERRLGRSLQTHGHLRNSVWDAQARGCSRTVAPRWCSTLSRQSRRRRESSREGGLMRSRGTPSPRAEEAAAPSPARSTAPQTQFRLTRSSWESLSWGMTYLTHPEASYDSAHPSDWRSSA